MNCRQARCESAIAKGIIGLAAVILASVSFVGCDWLFGNTATAYVAGYYGNGVSDSVACYWEGQTRHDLPSGGYPAEAAGISFSGEFILVAGSYKDASSHFIACEWIDGVKTDLPAPVASDDTRAVSAFGNGSDIYCAGFYYNNSLSRFVACYWKNGTATSLAAPGTDFAKAAAVAFDGSAVRVAGFHAATDEKACVWTDGSLADLAVPPSATKSKAYSIQVAGGHVYIAGYYTDGTVHTACVWVDGARVDLSAGTDGSASSAFNAGGTTYSVGYLKDGSSIPSASLWTGTSQEFLPAVSGKLSGASAVVAFDGSTYVSGFYGNASDVAVPCYWLDGAKKDLPTNAGLAGFATSIAVR